MSDANLPSLKSWIEIPKGNDFPIQNLPFGVFSATGASPEVGVAIGEEILRLHRIQEEGLLDALHLPPRVFLSGNLNQFIGLGVDVIRKTRAEVSKLLRHDNETLKPKHKDYFVRQSSVDLLLPVRVGNYTDFYSSEEHATHVGSMFRDPKNPLLPNWKHMPVGYHGRASSIVVSSTNIRRPKGQIKPHADDVPVFCPTRKLDFELEMAFITCRKSEMGKPVRIADTNDYIAGLVLFNDWSARDIQQWEYVPLGPFLGKSFASTISPWLVTLDALEPFQVDGPVQHPLVLPYLYMENKKTYDIILEVCIQREKQEPAVVCRTNYKYLYWNMNQQLAHQTSNGCNVEVGDIYASGTISGPSPGSMGSLLEITWNGEKPIHLPGGEERIFLEDGDTVIMKGYAEKNNVRIGFGECRGTVMPSIS